MPPDGSAGALRRLAAAFGRLLLPPACAACASLLPEGAPGADGIVCGTCWARLAPLAAPLCRRCGHPRLGASAAVGAIGPLPPCRWCVRLPPVLRALRSVCRMDAGTGAAIVHALKYEGWPRVAGPMARRMARLSFPPDVTRERVALVPMPLSRARRRERGYNQAEALADALSPHWGLPVWSDALVRARDTRSQVRLTPSQRAANVSHAFDVPAASRARLAGAHVVLVDDVVTTGATLAAAAEALASGGARIVSAVTFGRAPDPAERAALASFH